MNKKRFNHGYEIYKKYTIKDIFNLLEEKNTIPDPIIYNKKDYKDSLTRVNIIKQLIERDGCQCMNCKEVPKFFAMGKDNAGYWHLDLYSDMEGENYMYTIDHIHPKSKGGKNHIDNYQLLCKICNEDKSDNVIGQSQMIKKYKSKTNYINKKLTSLHQQTKGILTKIQNQQVICVKNKKDFTLGKYYPVIEIKIQIDKEYNSFYKFYTKNDNGKLILTNFNYFLTKNEFK